jgi:hypothetical protein
MNKYVMSLIVYLLIGFFTSIISCYLQSTFLLDFLRSNLVVLSIALLAINTATLGLLSTKIQDVYLNYKAADFRSTIKEMRKSLFEQVVIITMAIIVLIFDSSKVIQFDTKNIITTTLLCALGSFEIYILWDTGNAVFVLLDEIKKLNK